jgi:hypothetical protein
LRTLQGHLEFMDPYEPMQPREIRLLHFSTAQQAPRFAIVSVDDPAIRYIAVSYCWGTENCKHLFELQECSIPLFTSLFGFLLLARRAGFVGYLWADGICINQTDVAEKEQQIPLMVEVYSKALRVHVWLGTPFRGMDEAVDKAIRSMPAILDALSKLPKPFKLEPGQSLGEFGLPTRESGVWHGLGCLMRNPWFRRVWTLQEVILAREVHVWYGTAHIKWEYLGFIQDLLNKTALSYLIRDPYNPQPGYALSAHLINRARAKREITNPPYLHATNLLTYCNGRAVSHPSDRVYGIMGLVPPQVRQEIQVDYSLRTEDVYLQFVRSCIKHGNGMDLFRYHLPTPTLLDLPSWCPDFGARQVTGRTLDVSKIFTAGFRLPAASTAQVNLNTGMQSVSIQATVADVVDKVISPSMLTKTNEDGTSDPQSADSALEWEKSCLNMSQLVYRSVLPDAHVRTLCADQIHTTDIIRARRFTPEDLGGYHDMLGRWRSVAAGESSYSYDDVGYNYHISVRLACMDRCFFSTKEGRIGIGSTMIETGDLISVWKDETIPYVLRRQDKSSSIAYSFLGTCFVYGIMDGEVLGQSGFAWQDLVIT